MKAFKKLSAALLTLCLCVSCFSFVAHAADGRISFTDPSTAVGDEVEVKCVVRSTSSSLGNMEVKLSYDTASLKFESGDGVKGKWRSTDLYRNRRLYRNFFYNEVSGVKRRKHQG